MGKYVDYFKVFATDLSTADGFMRWDQAEQLMTELRSAPSMRLPHTDGGCKQRASLLNHIFDRNGFETRRAYASFDTQDPRNIYKWFKHVAATAAAGPDEHIVFDLTVCDRPVRFEEWSETMISMGAYPMFTEIQNERVFAEHPPTTWLEQLDILAA